MATSSPKFCSNCGFKVEKNFCFCPKCATEITANASSESATNAKALERKVKFTLPSFTSFKSKKEKERGSFQFRKKSKKAKVEQTYVTIQVGVMKDKSKVKRGETLPVKVVASATPVDILQAAKKKHEAFNKRFLKGRHYRLVHKDGTEVKCVPGTEEPFTLMRYKEESGFGYARITFYLLDTSHVVDEIEEIWEDCEQLCASEYESDGDDKRPLETPLRNTLPISIQEATSGGNRSSGRSAPFQLQEVELKSAYPIQIKPKAKISIRARYNNNYKATSQSRFKIELTIKRKTFWWFTRVPCFGQCTYEISCGQIPGCPGPLGRHSIDEEVTLPKAVSKIPGIISSGTFKVKAYVREVGTNRLVACVEVVAKTRK